MATPEDIYQTLIDAGFDPETVSEEDLRLILSGESLMDRPPEGVPLDDVRHAADPESMKHSAETPMVTRRIMAGGLDPTAQVVTPGGLKPVELIDITEEESIDVMAKGAEDYARDANRQAEKKKAMDAWGKRVSAARTEAHDPEEKFVPPAPKPPGAFLRGVVEYLDYSTDPPMDPGWEGAIYQDLAGLTMKGTDAYEKGRAAQIGRTGSGYYGISPGTSMSTGVMFAGPHSPFSYDDMKRRSGGFIVGLGMAAAGVAASVGRYSDQVADHLTESLLISAEADRVSRAGGTSFDWTFTNVDPGMGGKPFSTTINLNVDDVRLSDEEEAESAKELQSLQGKFGEHTAMHEALIRDRLGSNGASMVANLTEDFTHLVGSLAHLFARATGMIELPSQQATTNDMDYMIASARANFSLTNELGPAVIASLAHTVQNPVENFVARPFTFMIDAMPVWMWGKAAMARGIPVMTDSMLQWADLGLGAGIGITDMLQMAEARVLPRLSQAKATGLQAHLRPDVLGAPPGQLKSQALGEWLRRTRATGQAWMTDITAAREASGAELLGFILTEADRRSQIASTAIDLAARRAARGEIDTPGVTVHPKPRPKADRGQAPSQEYIETYPQSWEESQAVWDRAFEGRVAPLGGTGKTVGQLAEVTGEPGFVYTSYPASVVHDAVKNGKLRPMSPQAHDPKWRAWEDGSTELRTYWLTEGIGHSPGKVLLRARREFQRPGQTGKGEQMGLFDTRLDPTATRGKPAADFRAGEAGWHHTADEIPTSNLEFLGTDGKWHPLQPTAMAIREHGTAGAQAALEKIHRATADPQSGALLKEWSANDASAMLAMQAELTMQGVDTVDAFWMALERSIDQKINPKGQYPDPPGTDIALKGSTQPVPADVPNSIPVYTERATVDMSTGTVSYRPVATEAEVTAIRTKLEGLAEAGTVDAAFVREVMAMTKGEGKFAGIENRHLGPVPHSFSLGPQNVAIPARARIDPEAMAELTRFASSLGDTAVEGAQALKDMNWQISTSTLRYLPDMFRSPKLRSGVSSAMVKRAMAKMSPEAKAALPRGFAKQATKSLDKFLAKASDRVGPISGEPGSSLPLLLDIDFPGTGVRLSTVDFADAILGNATLRAEVIADAMHQTAVRYGIKTGQRARQSALVDAIDVVDSQIHAMRLRIHESMGAMGMDAGPPPVLGGEVASFADVARHAAEYTSVKGTLPAVIRAQPTEVAGWIEGNLSQLAAEAVTRRLGPRPRPAEPHIGPLREGVAPSETPGLAASQADIDAWARAHAKEMVRLRGVSGRVRAMKPLAEEVMDALRFKNADRDRVAASVQHSKQTGARDIRAVDIDAVGRGGSIFVDPRVADTLKMWSRWQKSWNAGSVWRALNNTAKMGLTARSTISAMNNYGSNSLQMMLAHGDITAGNASFFSVARDIWAKGQGKLTDMGRGKRLEAYFRTGELNSDIVSVEILDAMGSAGIVKYLEGKGKLSPEGVSLIEGLHKWTGTAKAERAYRGTDNIWKVVEAELNWPIIEGWLDNLGEGKTIELAIGRKETVKFQKVNGKLVDPSGKTISPHRLEDIIARAAIQPGINKFFNMRDTALAPRYIANEGPGFAVPFMSWAHQALFRAGKGRALPGLMFESLSGHPYIKTNDAGILSELAAKQTATSIRINAMQQAGSGTLYEEGEVLDRRTKRILDHLNAYGGGSRLMLANITATSRLEGRTIEQYNFGGPTIRALNAFEAALSTSAGFYHFAQSVLGAEDLGIYGEFTGDAMNLDQGVGAINEQIGDLRSRASILNESSNEDGSPIMSDRQIGFALAEQADSLKAMKEDMLAARKLAVKAMSGATFTTADLQDMFLVGGSILARSIADFRGGRVTWEQSGMNMAKMLLGGNVASFGQAIIDVSEEGSTSAWSTRHSSRRYEGHGESDVEVFVNRLTSLGLRTIDPYLMAKGKFSIHESNFKKGFSRDTGRIARAIFDRQRWIDNQLKDRPVDMGEDVGPPQLASPPLSSADRAKLNAEASALSRRMDSMIQFMRTFVSQTWDPKDDWGETPEHLKAARGLVAPKALIGRVFENNYKTAVEAFLEAGIEVTPSGGKALKKKKKEWYAE